NIKRSAGDGALHSRDSVQTVRQHISALGVFFAYLKEVFIRGIYGGFAGYLCNGWRAQTCLRKFKGGVVNRFVFGDQATQAGPAGAVAFRYGIKNDNVLFQSVQMHWGNKLPPIVAEF